MPLWFSKKDMDPVPRKIYTSFDIVSGHSKTPSWEPFLWVDKSCLHLKGKLQTLKLKLSSGPKSVQKLVKTKKHGPSLVLIVPVSILAKPIIPILSWRYGIIFASNLLSPVPVCHKELEISPLKYFPVLFSDILTTTFYELWLISPLLVSSASNVFYLQILQATITSIYSLLKLAFDRAWTPLPRF